MKTLFEQFISIVEKANGVRETMEENLKKYVEENKKALEDAAGKIKTQFDEMMKSVSDPQNIQEVMQKTMEVMTKFIGEENVKKLMEIQQKFPFINEYMKSLMPQK